MLPYFGSSAHMIQGVTLEAAIVALQHWVEQGVGLVASSIIHCHGMCPVCISFQQHCHVQ